MTPPRTAREIPALDRAGLGSGNVQGQLDALGARALLATGPSGPPGADGSPGAPGTPGAPGAPGAPGTPGADGSRGADGAPGPPGPPGQGGEDGADGPPGPPGSPGAAGATGAPGAAGAAGADGAAGAAGATGPPGSAGSPLDGQDGEDGFPIPGPMGPPGIGMVTAPLPGFAWAQQGASTLTGGAGNVEYMYNDASGGGEQCRQRYIAAPATPWTITAQLAVNWRQLGVTNFFNYGLFVGDGTKLITLVQGYYATAPDWYVEVRRMTAWNALAGVDVSLGYATPLAYWRAADDGVNLTLSVSWNGVDYYQAWQAGRTAFLTAPTRVGWMVNPVSSVSGYVTLLSWVRS